MIFEIGGRTFYFEDSFFAPAWGDNWVGKALKPKVRAFSKRLKEKEE
jgi:hypothetical protein